MNEYRLDTMHESDYDHDTMNAGHMATINVSHDSDVIADANKNFDDMFKAGHKNNLGRPSVITDMTDDDDMSSAILAGNEETKELANDKSLGDVEVINIEKEVEKKEDGGKL